MYDELNRVISEFFLNIVELNNPYFVNFKRFAFHKGMLFGSLDKWWDRGKRKSPHEGIDLYYFFNTKQRLSTINPNIRIPSFSHGIILDIIEDFLGYSIFVKTRFKGINLVWAFGHINIKTHIFGKKNIFKGEIIGNLSSVKAKKVPPHLHISVGVLKNIPCDFNWEVLGNSKFVELIDILHVANVEYDLI